MLPTRTSLLQRVRDQADEESWRDFVALYEPLLLSYVRKRGLTEIDARDVVQDVFILLLRVLPSFALDHTRGRFRTWLWQVVMNAIADRARRQSSRSRAEDKWREGHKAFASAKGVADESDPEWLAAYRQRILDVVLPQVQAQTQAKTGTCFEERLVQGRPSAAVAAEVGISANAVCVNAARVLAKVRQRCADYLEELGDDVSPVP